MTNHVHLLATPNAKHAVSRCMQFLGRLYVPYFNARYGRSGTLFEGRFKSCLVQEENYFLTCQRYIELNPVRAGMVQDPAEYGWSSYRAHAFGLRAKMWQPHAVYLSLGRTAQSRMAAYRALFADEMGRKAIDEIRSALNTGLALGGRKFQREVEHLTGQRQFHLKRGPKPKSGSLENEEFLL